MLVTTKLILDKAKSDKYGIVAPNVWNEDTIRAAISAAETERAPLILALYPAMVEIEKFSAMARNMAAHSNIPIAIHLDHGSNYEEAVRAIRAGFTSIMVDRSQLPFAENVKEVKEIVKMAHAVGVSVEAELGHVGQGNEYADTRDNGLTNVEEAINFVDETKVDCLAVAIGTSHGVYSGEPKIDFDLLASLNANIPIPLVLHGSSGTGDDNISKCIVGGINKINLFTDLDLSATEKLTKYVNDNKEIRIFDVLKLLYCEYTEKLVHNIRLVKSNNKA